MYIHTKIKQLIVPIILLFIVIACNSPSPSTPAGQRIDTRAHRDGVFVLRQPEHQPEALQAKEQAFLWVGDGINVDQVGWAEIRFADLFMIEILRDGKLILEELSLDEQSGVIKASQRLGTFFNDLPPQDKIKRRFTAESDFALITATGTQFLVVREAPTALEWVIALEAKPGDLEVTAKNGGASKFLTTGQALWIAPIGEPSETILYDQQQLSQWLVALQNGQTQPEVGEVLWQPADVLTNTQFVTQTLQPGSEFFIDGVKITLAAEGLADGGETNTKAASTHKGISARFAPLYSSQSSPLSEPPSYEWTDCNADGINDIVIRNGKLLMDFRGVLARVRTLDVTAINYAGSDQSSLSTFNPAYTQLRQELLTVGSPEIQILNLHSKVKPYHYAELAMVHGCFLGFSLTPPTESGEPGAPRSPITPEASTTLPPPTPLLTVTETITTLPTITATPTFLPPITATPTPLPPITATPTPLPPITLTPTPSPPITLTPTPSPTVSPSATSSPTMTPTPTETVTETPTPTLTLTPTETPTPTPTPTPTEPPLPDLVIKTFTAPDEADAGGLIDQLLVEVTNQGNAPANQFWIEIVISTDENIETYEQSLEGGQEFVQNLAPGESRIVGYGAAIPINSPIGSVFIGVVVDPLNSQAESDESNNTAAQPIEIYDIFLP